MKLVLIVPCDAARVHWPSVSIFNVVDDLTFFGSATPDKLGGLIGAAARYVCLQLERLQMVVSREKGVIVSSDNIVAAIIQKKLDKWDFTI
eukprot:1710186-Pyramimonas_sp.AAC.1